MKLIGNRLTFVSDAATLSACNSGSEFKDSAKLATEYTYDANGNLTKDLNKGIDIQYNVLNLPDKVTFSDGSTISYLYGANGVKLRTIHKIGSTNTTTDYCGNVIYENGVAKRLLTEEGYVSLSDRKYHYYLKDHQGNNRVVTNQDGEVEEASYYYPFGGIFLSTRSDVQPYKYNGKELDTEKGLNWYDYGAREYDAVLGRFTTMDPMAEKYYSVSPYAYCMNNPVKNIDPDGKQVVPVPLAPPLPLPLYYSPYQAPIYPTGQEMAKGIRQGVNNIASSIKTQSIITGGIFLLSYLSVKQALSPEYEHQRNRDRRNKEGLDQNQANMAKSIENNITATTPSGDPTPKRDPKDGGKKAKVGLAVITTVGSIRAGLELTNPDPSKDAVEAHTEKAKQVTVEKQPSLWEKIKKWF